MVGGERTGEESRVFTNYIHDFDANAFESRVWKTRIKF